MSTNKPILYGTCFILSVIIVTFFCTNAKAQGEITFKVNLTAPLKDSTFIPGRDQIYLKGKVYSLTNTNKIYLEDISPADSIYEATVDFPSSSTGRKLEYTFIIETPQEQFKEQRPRYILIRSRDQELDALHFNSFAW